VSAKQTMARGIVAKAIALIPIAGVREDDEATRMR
jgi:hypothetical protein